MPKLVWAVFCQQAIIDQTTNNVSVINQLDEIHPVPPTRSSPIKQDRNTKKKARVVIVFPCAVFTVWEREKPTISERCTLSVDLRGPKKEQLASFTADLDLRKHRRVRQVGNIPGIPLVGEGTYRFILRCGNGVKWRRVGEVTFEVKYAGGPSMH